MWEKIKNPGTVVCVLLLWVGMAASAQAGALGDVEDAAANREHEAKQNKKRDAPENDKEQAPKRRHSFLDWFVEEIILGQGQDNKPRVRATAPTSGADVSEFATIPREIVVEPPSLQIAVHYQYVDARTYAVDKRLELGKGMLGFDYRITDYRESSPLSELRVTRYNMLLRLQVNDALRFDIGGGQVVLDGAGRNSGNAWLAAVMLYPSSWQHIGLELHVAPASINGNNMDDNEFIVAFRGRHLALHSGYRKIRINGAELGGPFSGFDLHF